jgi:hypothetical protein
VRRALRSERMLRAAPREEQGDGWRAA